LCSIKPELLRLLFGHVDTYFKIETRFGNVFVTATGQDHIFADANHNCMSANLSEPDRHGPLTINRVQYGVNAHFYRWADGYWRIGLEDADWSSKYHSLYGSKLNSKSYNDSHMSEAARAKFTSELTPLINDWAKQNAALLNAATIEMHEDKVEAAGAAVLEARSALALAEEALEAAREALNAAKQNAKAVKTSGGRRVPLYDPNFFEEAKGVL
jgi:hypothetical protein